MKKFKTISKNVLSMGLVGAMLTLSGCGQASNEPSTTPDASTPPTNSIQVSATSSVVRTTINTDPDFLDPHLSASADTETMMNNVFEGLMGVTDTGEFVPLLATEYSVSEDGLIYTFTIKDTVTFHNGKTMTVDDVIYSYSRLAGLDGGPILSSNFNTLVGIHRIDDSTVSFTLSEPSSSFLSAMTLDVIPLDYADQSNHPIGTGAFQFDSYKSGQSLTLTAYPNYHNITNTEGIQTLEFIILPDPSTALLSLKSGDLDIAQISSINASVLEDEFQIISYPQNMVQVFAMNNAVAPFDDPLVRQAMSYAINKDLVINGAVNGYGSKIYSHASPVSEFWSYDFEGQDPYPYSPDLARELLAEAGYPDGFETSVRVPASYQTHIDTAQVIADMLSQVGVTLHIELIEWGQWLEQVYTNRDYATTIIALNGKPDPHDTYTSYTTGYNNNFYNFSDEVYDTLIEQASVTTDPDARATLYDQAQMILTEEAAAVYIMDPHLILAADKELMGFTPYPYQFFDGSKLFYTAE